MISDKPMSDLLAEVIHLAIAGAHQSTALCILLQQKGVVTREELDQTMLLTEPVLEKLRAIGDELETRLKSADGR